MEEKLKKLLEKRNVHVRYVQTGGNTGMPVEIAAGSDQASRLADKLSGGVLTMTPQELLERIRRFPSEVRDHPKLAKPLQAQIVDYNVIHNLPAQIGFRPDLKARWALEDLGRLKLELEQRLATARSVSSRASLYSQETQREYTTQIPYLSWAILEIDRIGTAIMVSPSAMATSGRSSIAWLRSRNGWESPQNGQQQKFEQKTAQDETANLNVQSCPIISSDTYSTIHCLLGAQNFRLVDPFDDIKVVHFRILAGENPEGETTPDGTPIYRVPEGWLGVHVNQCIPGTSVENVATELCKSVAGTSRFIIKLGQIAGSAEGNKCGYSSWNVACVMPSEPHSATSATAGTL